MFIDDLVVVLASLAVVGGIMIFIWALRSGGHQADAASRFGQTAGQSLREAALERSLLDRAIAPTIRRVGSGAIRFTPGGWMGDQRKLLQQAGLAERYSAEQVLGLKVAGLIIAIIVAALRLFNRPFSLIEFAMVAGAFIIGFFGPDVILRSRATERRDELTRLLPDFLDQLNISVEAGLGFEAALARMVQSETNYLTVEFSRMLRDVRLGTRRADALQAIVDRTQVDDIKTMVLSLRQADALGVPLTRSLRALATEMREKRRFRAEEIAHRLPVKMIFPLALCIMPALFIIMLGPAMLQFAETF